MNQDIGVSEFLDALRTAQAAYGSLLDLFETGAGDTDANITAHSGRIIELMQTINGSGMVVAKWCGDYCARAIAGSLHPGMEN